MIRLMTYRPFDGRTVHRTVCCPRLHIFELHGNVLPEAPQRAAGLGAGVGIVRQFDPVEGDVIRDRPAPRLVPLGVGKP